MYVVLGLLVFLAICIFLMLMRLMAYLWGVTVFKAAAVTLALTALFAYALLHLQ